MSENPLTSRWRENLHNRSGYVPNVEQRGSLCPLPGPFCMFTKKSDPLPLYAVRHHPPYPSTFLAPYFLITYIYILSASILLFFLFLFPFSFSHLSPPLPFFSVFLMLAHRSNHLFTYSFIYPRFLSLLEHWIILLVIRPITVSDRYFFLNLLSILLVEYYTRYDAKFSKKFF